MCQRPRVRRGARSVHRRNGDEQRQRAREDRKRRRPERKQEHTFDDIRHDDLQRQWVVRPGDE